MHSLEGSEKYYARHERCVHCDILYFELKEKERIIAENSHAVALSPFAARRPYEIRIFPKTHEPHFQDTPQAVLKGCVAMLQGVLKKVRVALDDPDLNFYIHSAPLKQKEHSKHYHWHIEILPNIPPPPGGFELGTGIEINSVGPENAAAALRGK